MNTHQFEIPCAEPRRRRGALLLIMVSAFLLANHSTGSERQTASGGDDSAHAKSPGTAATPSSSRLAVIRNAPDFRLSGQAGSQISMAQLKGKVVLVSFIFTTCNGSCPATTHRMGLVQRELKMRGLLDDSRVYMLSITLDPERDTPDVLRRYMELYDADPAHWSFLTGAPTDVAKTIDSWGMWVRPAANGQLDHPSRIFLVDTVGRIREIYNLGFMKPDWVAGDVQLLLQETEH